MKEEATPFPAANKENWLKTQQRILVYLRLLKVPPLESLEIALEATKRAMSVADAGQHPLRKSMKTLREVLREHGGLGREDYLFSDLPEPVRLSPLTLPAKDFCKRFSSHPPLVRGFMIPEKNI